MEHREAEHYDKTLTHYGKPPTMTIEEFMALLEVKLRERSFRLVFVGGDAARLRPVEFESITSDYALTDYCPIEFVANWYNAFHTAGPQLGLSCWDTRLIANAADNRLNGGAALPDQLFNEAAEAYRELRPRLLGLLQKHAENTIQARSL